MNVPSAGAPVRVLIASESKNPYVEEIADGLSSFFPVKRSVSDFLTCTGDYTIIHIQWPEELSAWTIPSGEQLRKVAGALQYWSSRAKIAVTRHNILPNKPEPEKYGPLYELVYSYADAVVHLGEKSLRDYEVGRPGNSKAWVIHKIIPHHIYESYPNTAGRKEARKYLRISEGDTVILCFGTIRQKAQFRMIFDAYRALQVPRKCLLIPRYKAAGYISRRYVFKRLNRAFKRWYFKTFFNVKLGAGFIESDRIQYFFNAADAVVVPRTNQLNSGVVFLALAFGKPFTGPATGNSEEVIKQFGYPVFQPGNKASVVSALEQILRGPEPRRVVPDETIRRFTLKYSIDSHRGLYRELADRPEVR